MKTSVQPVTRDEMATQTVTDMKRPVSPAATESSGGEAGAVGPATKANRSCGTEYTTKNAACNAKTCHMDSTREKGTLGQ